MKTFEEICNDSFIEMTTEKVVFQKKIGRNWIIESIPEGVTKEQLYHALMCDLIAKKLHNCTYIKSITDCPNYNGTRTITVTYDNNFRKVYTIKF